MIEGKTETYLKTFTFHRDQSEKNVSTLFKEGYEIAFYLLTLKEIKILVTQLPRKLLVCVGVALIVIVIVNRSLILIAN